MLISLLIASASLGIGESGEPIDFAAAAQCDAWLRHPVLGDPSFDAFEHAAGNPLHRGTPPYTWPVNGFLFADPASGNWFCYVGHYCTNYDMQPGAPSYCSVFRSKDKGAHWESVGPVFSNEPFTFEGEQSPATHWPDVAVIHADGRYHMAYDWATASTTWQNASNPGADANSGVGYAWAERPEGPFHRAPRPVASTRTQPLLLGKYKRMYASSIIRREKDWLVLTLTDSGPHFGWALLGMTAERPEGPYSPATLLLHPEADRFHPPLLEFFPAFTHEGFLYAPATSVALNRNYQAMFRCPIEAAMDPASWELAEAGTVWHAEPLENEFFGIWGQTFSGFVKDNLFHVMFPSRDSQGNGTINLATRPWDAPHREQGFVLSGHEGPSLGLLKLGGALERIDVELASRGTVALVWNYAAPLGPDKPSSGASLHPLMRTRHEGLELTVSEWRLYRAGPQGPRVVLASGALAAPAQSLSVAWSPDGKAVVGIDKQAVWNGPLTPGPGAPGLWVEAHSHARVSRFSVAGKLRPVPITWLYTEGLLDAAQNRADWQEQPDGAQFRFGTGVVGVKPGIAAKWNIEGSGFALWGAKGPKGGVADVYVDGKNRGVASFLAPETLEPGPAFALSGLEPGRHAVRLQHRLGEIPLDSLEVEP